MVLPPRLLASLTVLILLVGISVAIADPQEGQGIPAAEAALLEPPSPVPVFPGGPGDSGKPRPKRQVGPSGPPGPPGPSCRQG